MRVDGVRSGSPRKVDPTLFATPFTPVTRQQQNAAASEGDGAGYNQTSGSLAKKLKMSPGEASIPEDDGQDTQEMIESKRVLLGSLSSGRGFRKAELRRCQLYPYHNC